MISLRSYLSRNHREKTERPSTALTSSLFCEARKNIRGSIIWAGLAFGNPLLFQAAADTFGPLFYPQWGAGSLEQFRKSPQRRSSNAESCAISLGTIASELDDFLKEVEEHSPRYEGRIQQQHSLLKSRIVSIVKQHFADELPKPVEHYVSDREFHSIITNTLPRLFAPHRIAVHPHYYQISSEGAPEHFNLNYEIARVDDYGVKGFELWGSKVKRDVIILGENFSHITGSAHEYTIGDWLGLYSGQVFINKETTRQTMENNRDSASGQIFHSRDSEHTTFQPFSGSEAEMAAAYQVLTHCCKTYLGVATYRADQGHQRLRLEDLIKEVKIHEFGHGYRHQTLRFLRPESTKNHSVTEEAFAYAAEIGYAPRLDSVLIDLIQAQYRESSYEPHMQAKRLVWNLMINEIQSHPGHYGINEPIESRADAIAALPSLFDNNQARVQLSGVMKDQLIERSRLTLASLSQDINTFEYIPLGYALLLAGGAMRSAYKGYKAKTLAAALDRILMLDRDEEQNKRLSVKEFHAAFLKDQELNKELRSNLCQIASIGTYEAWDAAIDFCYAYYSRYLNMLSGPSLFYGILLVNKEEFAAIMLAPAVLAHHGNSIYDVKHFENFYLDVTAEDECPPEYYEEALAGTKMYFTKNEPPHPEIYSMLPLLPKFRGRINTIVRGKAKGPS